MIELLQNSIVHLLVFYRISLINAWNMDIIQQRNTVPYGYSPLHKTKCANITTDYIYKAKEIFAVSHRFQWLRNGAGAVLRQTGRFP